MSASNFFLPGVGTGLTFAVYLSINLAAMIGGISFPAWLFAHLRMRRRGKGTWPRREFVTALAISAGSTIFLMWLCYCAANNLQGSIYDLAQRLIQVLDPVLGVRQLVRDPINGFFGINLSLRIAAVCLAAWAVLMAWKGSGWSAEQFARYLERKFLSKKDQEDGKEPLERTGESSQSEGVSSTDEKAGNPSQYGGTSHWDVLLSRLVALLASSSGLGLLFYLLGPRETQDGIEEILSAVGEFLEQVTLLSQIDPGATGLAAFFTKSLFVVLSIFMLGIYVAVILLLAAFIQAIIQNRPKIIAWIEKKKTIIWTCLGVGLLAAGACAVIVAVGYGIKSGSTFIEAFQGRTLGIFLSNFAVLSISACAVLLMLLFVLSFAILASGYALQLVWALIRQWYPTDPTVPKGSRNAGRTAGMLAGAFVWTALLVAAGWSYPQIQAWLEDLFSNKDPLQLLGRFGLLVLMMGVALAIAAAGLLLVLLMLYSIAVFFARERNPIVDQSVQLLKSILLRTVEFFSLLPFFIKHAYRALHNVLSTVLQIFIGYRNESEKNSAIFTAACFASLASLLNTFFGLKGFYNASGHLELILCSAAIACAVQLAMLIFGMKAGEGLAEKQFMFGRKRKSRKADPALIQEPGGEHLPRPRRLPYYWYLAAYLLLMVVSTGFAFNNMFGYYASTSRVHERVYDQVRYKADEELQLSQTIGALISEYNTNTGEALALFSQRSDETSKVRMAIEASYRAAAAAGGATQVDANNRDRFIGKTRDLENLTAAIKSFLEADDEAIGKNVTILVEDYDHYWGRNPQPAYRTTCLVIYYGGDEDDKEHATIVGSYLDQNKATVTDLTIQDENGDDVPIKFEIARYQDPDSSSQTIIKLTRRIVATDKYGILRELIGQYEQLESRIYDDTNFNSIGGGHKPPDQSVGVLLNDLLTRNAELDGIRSNIAKLCRTTDGQSTSMQDLRQMANAYLNQDILPQGEEEGTSGPEANQQAEANSQVQSYNQLTKYINRALALYNILAGYTINSDGSNGLAEALEEATITNNNGNPSASSDSVGLTVQTFRNYAQGLTYSNFQISYDALTGGIGGLNPVRGHVDALYSSTAVAWFILIICFIVDMMAFSSGLFLFKDIYLFRKNHMIEEIGYLNYETALNSLFAIPTKESRERELCLAAVYKLLYGDADENGETVEENGGAAGEGGTGEENGGAAGEGGTGEENGEAAGEGGTGEENGEAAGESGTGEKNGEAAGEGGTGEENGEAAGSGGAEEEDSEAAGNGGTTEEDTSSAKDGEAAKEGSRVDRNGNEVPMENGNTTEENPPPASAEASKEADSQAERMCKILRSEDFKKYYRKVELVLNVLGISEADETSYGTFLLWLRSYAERNNLNFDDKFLRGEP